MPFRDRLQPGAMHEHVHLQRGEALAHRADRGQSPLERRDDAVRNVSGVTTTESGT